MTESPERRQPAAAGRRRGAPAWRPRRWRARPASPRLRSRRRCAPAHSRPGPPARRASAAPRARPGPAAGRGRERIRVRVEPLPPWGAQPRKSPSRAQGAGRPSVGDPPARLRHLGFPRASNGIRSQSHVPFAPLSLPTLTHYGVLFMARPRNHAKHIASAVERLVHSITSLLSSLTSAVAGRPEGKAAVAPRPASADRAKAPQAEGRHQGRLGAHDPCGAQGSRRPIAGRPRPQAQEGSQEGRPQGAEEGRDEGRARAQGRDDLDRRPRVRALKPSVRLGRAAARGDDEGRPAREQQQSPHGRDGAQG